MAKIDREELRLLVREALREALGKGGGAGKAPTPTLVPAPVAPAPPPQASGLAGAIRGGRRDIGVTVRTAEDLGRFAREIAEASADPAVRAAILEGNVRFTPAGGAIAAPPAAPAAASPKPTFEMKSGVLSETRLIEIGKAHGRIVLGADVVLTPLARDKAREMKIELTRQKP